MHPCYNKGTEKERGFQKMRNWIFQNIECGNILTYSEMIEEWAEMYDGGDPTNPAGWEEHYKVVQW